QPLAWLTRRSKSSTEESLRNEGRLVARDEEAGPSQLVRQRLESQDRVRLIGLAVVVTIRDIIIADGKGGGIDEGPRQIRIAVLDVSFALLLAVARPFRLHATTI